MIDHKDVINCLLDSITYELGTDSLIGFSDFANTDCNFISIFQQYQCHK